MSTSQKDQLEVEVKCKQELSGSIHSMLKYLFPLCLPLPLPPPPPPPVIYKQPTSQLLMSTPETLQKGSGRIRSKERNEACKLVKYECIQSVAYSNSLPLWRSCCSNDPYSSCSHHTSNLTLEIVSRSELAVAEPTGEACDCAFRHGAKVRGRNGWGQQAQLYSKAFLLGPGCTKAVNPTKFSQPRAVIIDDLCRCPTVDLSLLFSASVLPLSFVSAKAQSSVNF